MSFLIQFGSRTHGIVWKLQKYFSEGVRESDVYIRVCSFTCLLGTRVGFVKKVSTKYVCIGKGLCLILKIFFIHLILYNF